jgi:hypothetical protein
MQIHEIQVNGDMQTVHITLDGVDTDELAELLQFFAAKKVKLNGE